MSRGGARSPQPASPGAARPGTGHRLTVLAASLGKHTHATPGCRHHCPRPDPLPCKVGAVCPQSEPAEHVAGMGQGRLHPLSASQAAALGSSALLRAGPGVTLPCAASQRLDQDGVHTWCLGDPGGQGRLLVTETLVRTP